MKFDIRKEEIDMALKVIKDSKALSKSADDSGVSSILIEVDADEQTLRFTSTNYHVWCIVDYNREVFADYGADYDVFFNMKESGSVFVDGHEFASVLSGYPQNALISFSSDQKEEDGTETHYLQALVEKKGKRIKNSFITKNPKFFEKLPPEEEVIVFSVPTKSFAEAVNSVEFVSGTDEKAKWFWGVQIEVYGDEVAAMSTDKKRICYYDIRGDNREELEKGIVFTPIKTPLIAAIKNLKLSDTLEVSVGQKKTKIKQGWQTHYLPNVIFSTDSLPNWREFAKKLNADEERVNVSIPKKSIEACVKRALLSSGGYYGIKIDFNTEEKEVEFSIQKVEETGVIQSKFSETEPLGDGQFSGKIVDTVILTIDNLKDIISRSKSEIITFRVKDSSSPIQILNHEDNFGYIASTVKQS